MRVLTAKVARPRGESNADITKKKRFHQKKRSISEKCLSHQGIIKVTTGRRHRPNRVT